MERRIHDLDLLQAQSDKAVSPEVNAGRSNIYRKLRPFVLGAGLVGCGNQSLENFNDMENIGSVQQMSIADGYQNKVMVPAPVSVNINNKSEVISYAKDAGSNWEIYFSSDVNGGANGQDIFWATIDKTTLQTVLGPTIVSGANNITPDNDFKTCGGKAYYISDKDFLSAKVYICDIVNATTVANCTVVPGGINSDTWGINGIACSPDGTKLYVTKDVINQNTVPFVATTETWNWTQVTGCAEPGTDIGGLSVTNQHFIYDTFDSSQPNLNSKLKYKNFNGTQCTGTQMDIPDLNQSGYDVAAPVAVNGGIFYTKGVEGQSNYNPYYATEKPTPPVCGNGTKEGTEQCDNGANNTNTPCNAACNGSCNY